MEMLLPSAVTEKRMMSHCLYYFAEMKKKTSKKPCDDLFKTDLPARIGADNVLNRKVRACR